MNKPSIELNLGRETSDEEVAEILDAFSPYFDVSYNRNIVRLSAEWVPLVIDFTVAAVGGGLLYDALKSALNALIEKFRTKKLERKPAAVVHFKKKTFVVTKEKIFLQSIDIELSFNTVEEFVEYLQSHDN